MSRCCYTRSKSWNLNQNLSWQVSIIGFKHYWHSCTYMGQTRSRYRGCQGGWVKINQSAKSSGLNFQILATCTSIRYIVHKLRIMYTRCTQTTKYVHKTYACIPGTYVSTFVCCKFNHLIWRERKKRSEPVDIFFRSCEQSSGWLLTLYGGEWVEASGHGAMDRAWVVQLRITHSNFQ